LSPVEVVTGVELKNEHVIDFGFSPHPAGKTKKEKKK
jgi:hypothetical protein